MNVKTPTGSSFLILALVLAGVLLLIPLPQNRALSGVLLPQKEFTVRDEGSGYSLVLIDHLQSRRLNSQDLVPNRGSIVSFQVSGLAVSGAAVNIGDTLAWLGSSDLESDVLNLQGQIAVLEATLQFERSGSRQATIDAARQNLNYAKVRHEEQVKVLERAEDLFSRSIISQQEYDIELRRERLYAIRISIAEAELGAALSGAQTSKLELIRTRIREARNRLDFKEEQLAKLTVRSPIEGMVSYSPDRDSVLSVVNMDTMVVILPLTMSDLSSRTLASPIRVSSTGYEKVLQPSLVDLLPQVYALGDKEVMVARIPIENLEGVLMQGQRVEVAFVNDSQNMFQLLLGLLKG